MRLPGTVAVCLKDIDGIFAKINWARVKIVLFLSQSIFWRNH
jgi:hypothetical protein